MIRIKYIITTLIVSTLSISIISAQQYSNKLSPSANMLLNSRANSDSIQLKSAAINAETTYVNAYLIVKQGFDIESLSRFDCTVNMELDSILSVRFPLDSMLSVSGIEGVKHIEAGGKVSKKLDVARGSILYNKIEDSETLSSPYTGKGVVVGIVDQGFQFDHIAFLDSNENLRVKRVWMQNKSGTPPDGFSYGAELKDEASIRAQKYDDISGETHGTHVASTAAGSASNYSNYYGLAQESEIVLVTYELEDELSGFTSISDGVKYIYDYAESQNKPAVVNLSLGTSYGCKDGESIFDVICDSMQGEGRLLVGASGNSGTSPEHIEKEFTSDTDTLRTYFSLTGSYSTGSLVSAILVGDTDTEMNIQFVVAKYASGEVIYETDMIPSGTEYTYLETVKDGIRGLTSAITCTMGKYAISGRSYININAVISSINAGYALGIKVTSKAGTTIHGFANDDYCTFPTICYASGWSAGDTNISICEIGGTGKEIISVGAYKTKDAYGGSDGIDEIASFSSLGATLDGRMKPDISAPGQMIVAAYSNLSSVLSDPTYSKYLSQLESDTAIVNNESFYYGVMQGTSMSCPMVTGSLALWLQANPNLTPSDVRTILSETAIKDEFTGQDDNNTYGYGKIDAWSGLLKAINMASIVTDDVVVDKDITVYKSGSECCVLFGVDANDVNVMVYSISGHLVSTNYHPIIYAGSSISIPSLSGKNGIYIVVVSGGNFTQHSKIIL